MQDIEDYTDEDGTFDADGYMEDLEAEKADRWIKEKKETYGDRWFEYAIGRAYPGDREDFGDDS